MQVGGDVVGKCWGAESWSQIPFGSQRATMGVTLHLTALCSSVVLALLLCLGVWKLDYCVAFNHAVSVSHSVTLSLQLSCWFENPHFRDCSCGVPVSLVFICSLKPLTKQRSAIFSFWETTFRKAEITSVWASSALQGLPPPFGTVAAGEGRRHSKHSVVALLQIWCTSGHPVVSSTRSEAGSPDHSMSYWCCSMILLILESLPWCAICGVMTECRSKLKILPGSFVPAASCCDCGGVLCRVTEQRSSQLTYCMPE